LAAAFQAFVFAPALFGFFLHMPARGFAAGVADVRFIRQKRMAATVADRRVSPPPFPLNPFSFALYSVAIRAKFQRVTLRQRRGAPNAEMLPFPRVIAALVII
jgi:hypothetical protein